MGIFSGLFKKSSKLKEPADLSVLGTDVHSHFIPGIDDGAKTMEDSLNLIRFFHGKGYKKVITTPHIMGDSYRNTPDIILGGLDKVRQALHENNIPIEIEAAAEYYLDYDFEQKLKNEKLLTFGKDFVLVELSFVNAPDNLFHIFFDMQMKGYRPVLAHPERYSFWHSNFEKYEEIREKGVLLQMNINSLTGHYSIQTKRTAEKMIANNMLSFLGSDCHHLGHTDLIQHALYEKSLHDLLGSGKLLNKTL
ncbi:MAG: tyrosine-protein phosphatase [Bacteroidia bacterium]